MATALEIVRAVARLERRKGASRRRADAEVLGTAAAVATALDRLAQGVALVEAGGRVRFANRLVRLLGAEEDGLRIRGGQLSGVAMPEALHLSRALKCVSADGADVGLRLRRPSGKRPLFVLVTSLRARTGTPESGGALVLVTDPDAVPAPPRERLTQAYGLTAGEGTLVQLLLQGRDLGAAARAMNIRVTTARTHLRSILSKTGTHRQADLVRVLLHEVGRIG